MRNSISLDKIFEKKECVRCYLFFSWFVSSSGEEERLVDWMDVCPGYLSPLLARFSKLTL